MVKASSIGDRIRALREFRDVTQEELAARAEVHVDTIRKLEQGQRQSARLTTLRAIAAALDTELERLLGSPTVTAHQSDDATGGLLALRDAIQDVTALPGVSIDEVDEDPPRADVWADAVGEATSSIGAVLTAHSPTSFLICCGTGGPPHAKRPVQRHPGCGPDLLSPTSSQPAWRPRPDTRLGRSRP